MTRKDSHRKNPHKPKRDLKAYLKFIIVAFILIFLVEYFGLRGEQSHITKMRDAYYAEKALKEQRETVAIEALLPPRVVYPDGGAEYFEAPVEEAVPEAEIESLEEPEIRSPDEPEREPEKHSSFVEEEWEVLKTEPAIKKPVKSVYTKPKFSGKKAKIAIVIDDLGMNVTQSMAAIDLPAEVTLAFLPYAETVQAMSAEAGRQGHEMIIHTPMEAISSKVSLGPMALRSNMDFAAFDAEFDKMADSFEGYVGINNHMGSRLTQDPEAMGYLMDKLKERGLYFFDSKTIHTSIAAKTAAAYGVPFAVRDVFLDHVGTAEFTDKALRDLERVARKQGSAIAIGHPKAITMKALQKWIPTLEEKGFELVSLSTLLAQPAKGETPKIISVENRQAEQLNKIMPASGARSVTLAPNLDSGPELYLPHSQLLE